MFSSCLGGNDFEYNRIITISQWAVYIKIDKAWITGMQLITSFTDKLFLEGLDSFHSLEKRRIKLVVSLV